MLSESVALSVSWDTSWSNRLIGYLFIFIAALSAKAEQKSSFSFTKVDLDLLEQVEIMDKKLDGNGLVYHNATVESYLNDVGRALVPNGIALERVRWDFHVTRDPMPNAFALPNGSIYVNTGLMSLLENEDQLAGVLAHEITHVVDRHSYLHFRDYRKKVAIANIVSYAAAYAPGGNVWGQTIRLGATLVPFVIAASINGYSRELERNADTYALDKLIERGYDPKELASAFRLLQRKDEVELQKVYYTDHPKLQDRIAHTEGLIGTRKPNPVPADVLEARKLKYRSVNEELVREDVHLAILSHRSRTALVRAKQLVEFNPDRAANYDALGEAYSSLGPLSPEPEESELTSSGKKETQRMNRKLTPDEQERALLLRSNGAEAEKQNSKSAESAYLKALSIDPRYAVTYRGLGQVYETMGRSKEALQAYQRYLELQPNALDQQRIRAHLDSLQRTPAK